MAPFLSLVLFLVSLCAALPAVAADLQLVDEREAYAVLDKLNAMGLLPGFHANTRPYDMREVRAALRNESLSGPGVDTPAADFVRWARLFTDPTVMAQGEAALSYSRDPRVEWNDEGIPVPEDFSARFSAVGRYEPFPWLSFDAKASAWTGSGDERGARVRGYSAQLGHKYIALQGGEIATWYGPGRRGALIFTNNAQPYPGVRLHNPVPIPFTGFLSFLGTLKYDLFVAQMDEDRPVPETYLSGARLAFRFNRYMEIGLSRAMHFKGVGGDSDFKAWWKAFKGEEDGGESSPNRRNQLGGFDAALTLPFKKMPVQLYIEMAGEDQSRGGGTEFVPAPEKYATLVGVFFPAVFGNPVLDLRVEYADNHSRGDGPSWYVHSFSPHGYKERILGHAMGTDARDLSFQGRWFLQPSRYMELTLSRTERFSEGPLEEETIGCRLAFLGWITSSVRAGAGVHVERIENAGGMDVEDDQLVAWIDVAWRFSASR